jgi:hypothetical protein
MDRSGTCNVNFIQEYDEHPGILVRGITFDQIRPIEFKPSGPASAQSAPSKSQSLFRFKVYCGLSLF